MLSKTLKLTSNLCRLEVYGWRLENAVENGKNLNFERNARTYMDVCEGRTPIWIRWW